MLPALSVPSSIRPMSERAIDAVRELQSYVLEQPQLDIPTDHVLHAGLYARTILVPPSVVMTGVLIKIATLLIVNGDADVWLDGEAVRFTGYHVLTAGAGRKQALVTHADTTFSMIFATKARTVEEAEVEFTDEWAELRAQYCQNRIRITGE